MTRRAETLIAVALPPVAEPPERFDPSDFCRGVNERILELAPHADAIDFVCECGNPRCFVTVVLSVAEFRDASAGGYVVARGHAYGSVLARSRAGYEVEFAPERPEGDEWLPADLLAQVRAHRRRRQRRDDAA